MTSLKLLHYEVTHVSRNNSPLGTRDSLLPYTRRGGRLAGALTPKTLRPEDGSESQGLTFPVNVSAILVKANLKIQNSA